jgi:hypothetical protein
MNFKRYDWHVQATIMKNKFKEVLITNDTKKNEVGSGTLPVEGLMPGKAIHLQNFNHQRRSFTGEYLVLL